MGTTCVPPSSEYFLIGLRSPRGEFNKFYTSSKHTIITKMIYWIDFQIYFYGFSIFFIHYTFMDLFSKVLLDDDGNFFQFWISPVIFGNKIQKMWLVTAHVTVGQWRHMWLISKRHQVCFTETKSKAIWKRGTVWFTETESIIINFSRV